MAQPYVPPWLQISPESFVQAAQGGARIGAELAGQGTEANIAAGRNATALQEAQMRIAAESQSQDEASQRAAAERMLREWEIRQQILHQNAALQGENQRNQNTVDAENQRAAAALAERQQYGGSMLDIRREANRIAQERADAEGSKQSPYSYQTVSEHTKEIPDSKSFDVNEPEIHNFFSKNTPGKNFNTTNISDLVNLPRGSSIVTNTIPGTGTPARTISRRIPAGQDPYSLSASPVILNPPPAPNPLEGKKVRDKVTGKVGMISNGEFVPDTEDQNLDGDAASM